MAPIIAPQGMVWTPTWKTEGKTYHDVLFVVDPARNRIAAYPNSSTRNTSATPSAASGMTVYQGRPLKTPAGLVLNPINGDLLVVNQANNNLYEIDPSNSRVVGIRIFDNKMVDPKTGANSALFGVVATKDAAGNLQVFFTDDNTNTLDLLTV